MVSGMSEQEESSVAEPIYRCPVCDSVVAVDVKRCLMCGAEQPERPLSSPEPEISVELSLEAPSDEPAPEHAAPAAELPAAVDIDASEDEEPEEKAESEEKAEPEEAAEAPLVFVHVEDPEYTTDKPLTAVSPVGLDKVPVLKPAKERMNQSWLGYVVTAVVIVIMVLFGILSVRTPEAEAIVAQASLQVLLSPSATPTPEPSPLPTETEALLDTPTLTLTPAPTHTLQPPREHTISVGDTLFGLALQYRVSLESILAVNGMTQNSPIIAGQPLLVPWPTATPPLVPVGMEFNGELVIADPTDCRRYEVVSGDSLNAIAARADVDYDLFLLVNRLTSDSIIQPGDTICIPEIVYGATLQPTPGPSPTPSLTPLPPGPSLLYPVQDAAIEQPAGVITLQWVALHDLAGDEWYMVELTDMNELASASWRGFTRDTAFQVPSSWRPAVADTHQMRWRVSLVKVVGFREDGLPIFTFGGQNSQDAFFNWLGAAPTATPLPTATATPTPDPRTATPQTDA